MFREGAIRRAGQAGRVERDKPMFWVREVWVLLPEVEAWSLSTVGVYTTERLGAVSVKESDKRVSAWNTVFDSFWLQKRRMIS